MNVYPQITYGEGHLQTDGSTTYLNNDIYISLFDENQHLTNGNGMLVTYQAINSGTPGAIKTVNIYGSGIKIFSGTISTQAADQPAQQVFSAIILSYEANTPSAPPTDPLLCDVKVISVVTLSKETAPGAANGQVAILADTSHLPLTFSLNGVDFTASGRFTGLQAGAYTAYVSDGAGCTTTYDFNLDGVQNLLIDDPSANVSGGNLSRWSAAYNPIVFTYQRKDFQVTAVNPDGNNNMIVTVNASLTGIVATNNNIPGDMVYINAGPYNATYTVAKVAGNQLYFNSPYIAPATGFININRLRPYYQVLTEITYFDTITNSMQKVTSTNRPDTTGLVRADISSFLQSILHARDDSNYTAVNYRDMNLSASYTIRYAEQWDNNYLLYFSINHPYYIVYAARQLGDAYGGNLAAYVPFLTVPGASQRARWLTDFAEPAYSNGYPFDIGFIYSEALAGRDVYCELTLLDINRHPITGSTQTSHLLNEDSAFLLNQDGSKLIIADGSVSSQPLVEHVGLNRLLVNQNFSDTACYFTLTLKYDDDSGNTHIITQTQTVRIDGMVDNQSVYLRWIGLSGCWNYYRFVFNQEVSLDVQNATIIKNYVTDWANQDGIEEVIGKEAGQKMQVMAEDLSVADIKGLQSIKYSPKVQMLMSRNPVKWQTVILNTATFSEYETQNGQAPFSVTFNMPSINIQTQ